MLINPYIDHKNVLIKLVRQHREHGTIGIGVDFDHTLVNSYDETFPLFPAMVELLKQAQSQGCILCVWTANGDEELVRARWKEADLTIDHYNFSPISWGGSVKQHFNLLLDDTAGLKQTVVTLRQFLYVIE